jgi:hypothetical protein
MSREPLQTTGGNARIYADGAYRLFFTEGKRSFLAAWEVESVPPAGVVSLSFDGNPAVGAFDLAAGENVQTCSSALPFLDLDVTGLPEGGGFRIYALKR